MAVAEHGCPTCGRTFETRRGLGVHHSRIHDERLPNRECDNCGEEFYSAYARAYCSENCHDDAVSYEGEANPNYRGAKKTTACEICGATFEYYPSEKKGQYCPTCVQTEQWRNPDKARAVLRAQSRGRIELTCEVCEASVRRYPSEIYGEVVVCGEDCRSRWLSRAFEGEGHPNWRGGDTASYGQGWNRVRKQALERDGYACILCGTDVADLGRNPDVHHIIPVRLFRKADEYDVSDAHYLENVVTLCPGCHRKAEFGNVERETLRVAATET